MNENFIARNKELIYLLLIAIAIITFFPLLFTGFATADDFHYYLVTRRGQVVAESQMFGHPHHYRIHQAIYSYCMRLERAGKCFAKLGK